MGLIPAALQLLIRMHRQQSLADPLLTLGVQDIHASYEQLEQLFAHEGVTPCPVAPEERVPSTSLLFQRSGIQNHDLLHEQTFYRMLGIKDYQAMDAFTSEGASLAHDLNQPVPLSWHGRFGTLLDSGTLEHVLDVRSTLANIMALLRVGGTVIHISPLAGWANHGFYQISPTLYYDFYPENGFSIRASYTIELPTPGVKAPGKFVPYEFRWQEHFKTQPDRRYLLVFIADKHKTCDRLTIPTQAKYRKREAPGGWTASRVQINRASA